MDRVEASESIYSGFCGQLTTTTTASSPFCECLNSTSACGASQFISTCQAELTSVKQGKHYLKIVGAKILATHRSQIRESHDPFSMVALSTFVNVLMVRNKQWMSYPNMEGIFVLLRFIVAFVSVIGVDITASLKNSSIAPRCGTSGYDYDVNYVPSVCTFYKIYMCFTKVTS